MCRTSLLIEVLLFFFSSGLGITDKKSMETHVVSCMVQEPAVLRAGEHRE